MNQNAGGSMVFEYLVQPQEFTTLHTGGREAGFEVAGIIFQGGRRWLAAVGGKSTAKNYIRHSFNQIYHEGPPG